MGKNKITRQAASRIQSASDRNSDSATAKTGFASRAQSAAASNSSKK